MQNQRAFDDDGYDWKPCRVTIPRFGLLVSRHGMSNRLIWPGQYLVCHSRTFMRPVYRRRHRFV